MAELDDSIVWNEAENIMAGVGDCIAARRRSDAPNDTGELAGSISAGKTTRKGTTLEVVVTQDSSAAPHGAIIENATGTRLFARDYGHRSFAPFNGTIFRASFTPSTANVGWWGDYNWDNAFDGCLR